MKLEYRAASVTDAAGLAPRLRASDVAEIRALSDLTPAVALAQSWLATPEPIVAVVDGTVEVMFGVVPVDEQSARIWLLGSDAIPMHSRVFLRETKKWVEAFNERYPILFNDVPFDSEETVKWLQWLGFRLVPYWDRRVCRAVRIR